MPWVIVPLDRKEFGYFDRQRDLFSDWQHLLDDTWRDMGLEDSQERFNRELDRVRDDLHRMDVQPVVLDVQHPFIIDPEGNHKFCLRFNCNQFKPDEIEVKTMDKTLKIHAKHVQETESRKIHQEFTREFELPDNVDPDKLKSHLSEDGVLQIEAPVPPPPEVKAPKEILIPIQHLESKKKPKKDAAKEPTNEEKEPKEDEKEPPNGDKNEPKENEKETKEDETESKGDENEPKENEKETKGDETESKGDENEPKGNEKETKGDETESKGDENESKGNEKETKEDEKETKGDENDSKGNEKETKGDEKESKGDEKEPKMDEETKEGEKEAKGDENETKEEGTEK